LRRRGHQRRGDRRARLPGGNQDSYDDDWGH
jgi:hypothetical protein